MTLIIVIYTSDNHDKKEIFFASDGLAIKYEDNRELNRYEDVEKIRKLTPEIYMTYAGKNSELFEDVFDELKNKISETIKRDPVAFAKKLREIILEKLETKKHKEIEEKLIRCNQLCHNFYVGGVFDNKPILIREKSGDNYKISVTETRATVSNPIILVAGSTDEIQEMTYTILKKKLVPKQSNDEIEDIIRDTISEVAKLYPDEINDHVFVRRLSKNFDKSRI